MEPVGEEKTENKEVDHSSKEGRHCPGGEDRVNLCKSSKRDAAKRRVMMQAVNILLCCPLALALSLRFTTTNTTNYLFKLFLSNIIHNGCGTK